VGIGSERSESGGEGGKYSVEDCILDMVEDDGRLFAFCDGFLYDFSRLLFGWPL
jgi:hypothetical protein